MSTLHADLRYAIRRWAARPGLAMAAVLTLGLGMGTATAVFTVVDGVLLRPLPFTGVDRLVSIWIVRPFWRDDPAVGSIWNRGVIAWNHFRTLQTHTQTFAQVAVWSRPRPVRIDGETDLAQALQISSSFFALLHIQPFLGRGFAAAEDDVATEAVIVTYESWQRRFGADPGIVGREIVIDDVPRTIVGVMPPRFTFEGRPAEFVIPFGNVTAPNRADNNNFLYAIGRLAPGATIEQASAAVAPVLRAIETGGTRTSRLEPYEETFFRGQPREALLVLLGAAGLLLLIACANVAGLLVGDAGTRRHEIAVRRALGAARGRIARQIVVECSVLAVGSTAVGLAAAWWTIPVLIALAPAQLPRIDQVAIDTRVLAVTVLAGIATVVIFGLAPAIAGASVDPADSLRDARSTGRFRSRLQRMMVAGQIALAVVLLAGAALLGETVAHLRSEPVGFDPAPLAVVRLRGPNTPDMSARQLALLDRIRSLPGVAAAGATTSAPFAGSYGSNTIEIDATPGEGFIAQRHIVTDGYFAAMGQPVAGRAFSSADRDGDVAIISQSLAGRFPNGDAIGRRLQYAKRWFTIVGIVPDIRIRTYTEPMAPAFYLYAAGGNAFEIVVRAEGDPRSLLSALKHTVLDFDGRQAFATLQTVDRLMADTIDDERYRATLAACFGIAALLLTGVGLYGLLARTVASRQREIGVRVAVGARPLHIVRLIMSDAGVLIAGGLAAGVPAAIGASHALQSLLYGVQPTAPHVFIGVSMVVAAIGASAMLIPSARASRVDPMITLRSR
jgi:predicted permease